MSNQGLSVGHINYGTTEMNVVATPSVVSTNSGMDPANHVQFQFQVGLHREQITAYKNDLTMTNLKDLACSILERNFPQAQVCTQLSSKLNLFRHDPSASNMLGLLQNAEDVKDGTLIEIVLSADVGDDNLQIRPHALFVHSYKSPTFCDHCGEMLWGIVRQGLKCDGCGQNYHKRCAYKIPNNCTLDRKRQRKTSVTYSVNFNGMPATDDTSSIGSGGSTASLLSNTPSTPKNRTYPCRPLWMEKSTKIKVPHSFQVHSYTRPTVCQQCKKLLRGLVKQGLKCKDCKFNCHKKCMRHVPENCPGEEDFQRRSEIDPDLDLDSDDSNPDQIDMDVNDSIGTIEEEPDTIQAQGPVSPSRGNGQELSDGAFQLEDAEMLVDDPSSSNNIPLMRVVQSVKHTKKPSSTVLKEGWLVHFSNRDPMRKRYFWRVDSKTITLYQQETGSKYYKEVPLSEVLSIDGASNLEPGFPPYQFKVITSSLHLFVRDDTSTELYVNNIQEWIDVLRQALMPVVSNRQAESSSNPQGSGIKRKVSVMVSLSKEQPEDEKVTDISQVYQIFPDEVLGSGQFGIVYGGKHRKQAFDVAVKVVDKLRFPHKEESQLRHEVQILEYLDQPGIVKLYNMFETPEQVFVVMEKLRGDMLEMILSSEKGRLPERITKFLISQILIALRYLHMKNIVHCDLKPENVLLSSDDPFPQVKLCDFGFARIIGEKSFRRSVVGTPAYLAPEVLRKQSYNRSLDMWSVGVIVYVSLSGTFPFNEDEDINQQIQNAAFMYPPTPWRDISKDAIELIMDLLQVKKRKRLSVDKALNHVWLQDYQVWQDLRELETSMGRRYLTHESDDERWENYRREHIEGTVL